MVFFLLILILIICNEMHFCDTGTFNDRYMDKRTTGAVNGIFVIMVVFSHYAPYATLEGIYDEPYLILKSHLSQLVVATFLFYSGYGMMESIKRKGQAYVNRLPAKFGQLLIRYWIVLILAILLNIVMHQEYPVYRYFLAFTLWEGIGISNWYIFDILIMYLLIFSAFRTGGLVSRKYGNALGIALTFLFTAGFVYALISAGKEGWWYNTLILLPLGFLYSAHRERIDKVIMRSGLTYSLTVLAATGLYIVAFFHKTNNLAVYYIWTVAFILLILLFTMKVRIGNPVLDWFGQHVFSIYILQRLPMKLFSLLGFTESHRYISLIAVFAVTVPMAIIFDNLTGRLFSRRNGGA